MAEISKMLPGYNCGECGHRQCKDYAEEISLASSLLNALYLHAFANIEDADTLWTVELVSGNGEGINTKGFDIYWYLANGLNAV